jgi:hypothetical protein
MNAISKHEKKNDFIQATLFDIALRHIDLIMKFTDDI